MATDQDQEEESPGGPLPVPTAAPVNVDLYFLVAATLLALGAVVIFAYPGLRTPTLHTILDTSVFQANAVIALLLWQVSNRTGQGLARLCAVIFTVVAVSEIGHTFTAIKWTAGLGGSGVVDTLAASWGPGSYILPVGLLALPAVQRLPRRGALVLAIGLATLAVVLFWLFEALPGHTAPGVLGITRPLLAPIPILWLIAGLFYWSYRELGAITRAAALMAALVIAPYVAMLYSQSPYDVQAFFAHLGKLDAALFLLFVLTQIGTRDSALLAETRTHLSTANVQLEDRVRERTMELLHSETRLRAQVGRLHLLNQITRAIGDRLDLDSIFQIVVRSLEDRLPVDFASLLAYDAQRGVLVVSKIGAKSAPVARAAGLFERTVVEIDGNGLSRCVRGEVVYEPDMREVPFAFPTRLAGCGLRALAAAPLRVGEQTSGILVIARNDEGSFSSTDCEFLRQLCEQVALAVQQAQLHTTLQQAYDDLKNTREAALQHERLRAIGQMASGIAHDINNAISPVSLYTQSLLETGDALDPKIRGYLTTVRRVVDDVSATVSRMRELYRPPDAQRDMAPVSLNEIVGQTVELTRARWSTMPQERGIVVAMTLSLAAGLPPALGVASEIREALTNLVFNAVDAMPEGGTLTVATWTVGSGRGARVALEISDTGVGMSEEVRKRCLEPFYTTKGDRGTGLGLAMVSAVAQRHNADFEIDSTLGNGTTIRLVFRVAEIPDEAATRDTERGPADAMRILLVDDDPFILDSMRAVLEIDGHTVVEASGGQAGIDAFRASLDGERFDIVITDLGMPGVNGTQVIVAVKRASSQTPVILLTGWGRSLQTPGDAPTQADFILPKPPDLDELREVLSKVQRRSGG